MYYVIPNVKAFRIQLGNVLGLKNNFDELMKYIVHQWFKRVNIENSEQLLTFLRDLGNLGFFDTIMEKLQRAFRTVNISIDIKKQFEKPTQDISSAVVACSVALVVRIYDVVKSNGDSNQALAAHFRNSENEFFKGFTWFISHSKLNLKLICEHLGIVSMNNDTNRVNKNLQTWPALNEIINKYPMLAKCLPIQLHLFGAANEEPIAVVLGDERDEGTNDNDRGIIDDDDYEVNINNKGKRKRKAKEVPFKKRRETSKDDSSGSDEDF